MPEIRDLPLPPRLCRVALVSTVTAAMGGGCHVFYSSYTTLRVNKNFGSPVAKRRSERAIPAAAPHAPPVVQTLYEHQWYMWRYKQHYLTTTPFGQWWYITFLRFSYANHVQIINLKHNSFVTD